MLAPARALALLLPAALLAGALGSQYLGHLVPCEMCLWQRWPHYAAVLVALAAIAARGTGASRPLVLLAALLILSSGAIGVLQAGTEYHWWEGPTRCTATGLGGGDPLRAILAAPLVRCDQPQWTLFNVSLAGWNALFSIAGAITIVVLCLKPAR